MFLTVVEVSTKLNANYILFESSMANSLLCIPRKVLLSKECRFYALQKNSFSISVTNQQNQKVRSYVLLKRGAGVLGAVSLFGGAYYLTLDEKGRRKFRVSFGGIGRFFR